MTKTHLLLIVIIVALLSLSVWIGFFRTSTVQQEVPLETATSTVSTSVVVPSFSEDISTEISTTTP